MTYTNNTITHVRNGVLHLKKRRQSQWILLFVMMWPFMINLISSLPSPLSYAQYFCDGIMICWCMSGLKSKTIKMSRDTVMLVAWIGMFLAYTLLAYMLNYQSAIYYLWGVRNNFRAYLLFLRIISQVKLEEMEEWFGILDELFWINACLAVIQFAFLNVNQDNLGGIFGIASGTNGFMLIFLSIVTVRSQLKLFEHKEKLWICLLKSSTALLIAAMAELKFFLLLFVFQLILVVALTSFSWKKIIMLPLSMIAAYFAMQLLAQWFSSSGTFDIAATIDKAFQKNYASSKDLNRLSAIGTLTRTIMRDTWDSIFGLGLGNCDSANFAFLRTPFYERYSYLHYRWFMAPMMYLETGFIGLTLYLGFFILCFIKFVKRKKYKTKDLLYVNLGIIFAVTAILLAFYNASLRYEGGWMIYIVLAAPFVSTGQSNERVS